MESINKKTVHEELAKNLIFYLRLGADPTMIANILQVFCLYLLNFTFRRSESHAPFLQCILHSAVSVCRPVYLRLLSRVFSLTCQKPFIICCPGEKVIKNLILFRIRNLCPKQVSVQRSSIPLLSFSILGFSSTSW